MNTVLITGCSSGFGFNTAKYFLERDWNVIASMRSPRKDLLPPSARLRVLGLATVSEATSIARNPLRRWPWSEAKLGLTHFV